MTKAVQRAELGDILDAIREVETSLDRRADRAGGALMVMWGVIVALIAAFYQVVTWSPEPYQRALGPLLPWAWVAPVAVGYAAGALVGVRVAARAEDPAERRRAAADFAPALVSTAIAAALVLAGRHGLIPGALLVGFGVTLLLRCLGQLKPRLLRAAWAAAAVCAVAGVALLVRPFDGAWWVMGVVFGGSVVLLGWLRMTTR